MKKTIYSNLSGVFCEHVRALRENANMTQRDLAKALGREHGMVARIELGERRVDFVEVYQMVLALGVNPEREATILMRKLDKAAKSLSEK